MKQKKNNKKIAREHFQNFNFSSELLGHKWRKIIFSSASEKERKKNKEQMCVILHLNDFQTLSSSEKASDLFKTKNTCSDVNISMINVHKAPLRNTHMTGESPRESSVPF